MTNPQSGEADLHQSRMVQEECWKKQAQRYREQGEVNGKVTIVINGTGHAFPAGEMSVKELKRIVRLGKLYSDENELEDSELLTLRGGDLFEMK